MGTLEIGVCWTVIVLFVLGFFCDTFVSLEFSVESLRNPSMFVINVGSPCVFIEKFVFELSISETVGETILNRPFTL